MLSCLELAALVEMSRSDYEQHVKDLLREFPRDTMLWNEMAEAVFEASDAGANATEMIDRAILRRTGFYDTEEKKDD